MAFILVTKQTTYLVFSAALLFFHFLVSAYRAHPSCTLFGLCTTRWSWNPFGIPLCGMGNAIVWFRSGLLKFGKIN